MHEYTRYCHEHKLKIESSKVIKHALEQFGAYEKQIKEDDGKRPRVWQGIRLRTKNEETIMNIHNFHNQNKENEFES
jgi:hypothetical protein